MKPGPTCGEWGCHAILSFKAPKYQISVSRRPNILGQEANEALDAVKCQALRNVTTFEIFNLSFQIEKHVATLVGKKE